MIDRFRTFIDAETTGLSTTKEEFVEWSAYRCCAKTLMPVSMFHWMVKPSFPMPAGAYRVHKIAPYMYANAISMQEFVDEFVSILRDDENLTGHNIIDFDIAMMDRFGFKHNGNITDTMKMARANSVKYPHGTGQEGLCKYYGITYKGAAHRTDGDVKANRELWIELDKEEQGKLF